MEMCNPTSGSCITGDTTLLAPFSDQQQDPSWLPPGFRFHPTDEELVTFYLAHKIQNPNFCDRAIAEADLNRSEPWELPAQAKMGEKEWYFYSSRDRKYPTGMRTNRATHAGYWKATGKDREVVCSRTRELVGMKKTLVFYRGRAPRGIKTNWVMHEYRTEPDIVSSGVLAPHTGMKARPGKDEWVVCRVFHKSAGGKKMHLTELKQSNALFGGGRTGELVDAGGAGSISKLIGETLPALMELPCASSGFGTQFWQMMQSSPDWGQPRQAFFSGGLTSNAVPQSTLQRDLGNLSFPPHPSCASDIAARNPNLALLHNTPQCRSDNSSFLSVETTKTQHMSTATDGPGVGFLDHATLKAIFDRYQSGEHGEVKVEPGVNMYSYSKEQESSMEAHQAGTGVSLEGSSSSSTCAGSGAAVRAMESLKNVQQQHHQASMVSLKNLQQLSPASDFSCTHNSSAIPNYKALSDLESLYWSFAQHIPPH